MQSAQDSHYFEFHVSGAEQARWLTAGYRVASEAGDVKGLGWFTLLDPVPAQEGAEWG